MIFAGGKHPMSHLTKLLGQLQAGDRQARDALFAAAYTELHGLARSRLRGGGRDSLLDTTCLVHEALEVLERVEPRLAEVAQMRYFGGYNEQEIAETLNIGERTVRRDWEKARLILAELVR